MWASDCARLEEAYQRGDNAEVLIYGRKYVVDMKVKMFVNLARLSQQCTNSSILRSPCASRIFFILDLGSEFSVVDRRPYARPTQRATAGK